MYIGVIRTSNTSKKAIKIYWLHRFGFHVIGMEFYNLYEKHKSIESDE